MSMKASEIRPEMLGEKSVKLYPEARSSTGSTTPGLLPMANSLAGGTNCATCSPPGPIATFTSSRPADEHRSPPSRRRAERRAPPVGAALAAGAGHPGAVRLRLLWSVSARQALLLLVGVGLGWALAAARWPAGWRRLVERDPSGVYGQIILLAALSLLSVPLLACSPRRRRRLGALLVSLLISACRRWAWRPDFGRLRLGHAVQGGLGVPLNMAILPLFALGSSGLGAPQWLAGAGRAGAGRLGAAMGRRRRAGRHAGGAGAGGLVIRNAGAAPALEFEAHCWWLEARW